MATSPSAQTPFATAAGLFDQADSVDLGLAKASGTETFTVYAASASTDKYVNGAALVAYKGVLYCQWQTSALHEDSTDTRVVYSRSTDGKTWSSPQLLSAPGATDIKTSGGWWVNGDTLVAFVNVWTVGASPRGGSAWYATSIDGAKWSALQPVKMSDGKAMAAVFEQDPRALPDGRIVNAAHFQPGLLVSPIYTDDPSGVRGWKRATYSNLSVASDVSRELEPSSFRRADGTLVMVFRDQSGTYRKLASTSTDRGATWSTAVLTDMPDSRAKQSAGNLPDGTAYQVNNPVAANRRSPLAVALSKDGSTFSKGWLLRAGGSDLPARQWAGKAKTLGYSYPKSTTWGDHLYVAYATNKEILQVTRVPLASIAMRTVDVEVRTASMREGIVRREDCLELRSPGPFTWQIRTLGGALLRAGEGADEALVDLPAHRQAVVVRLVGSRGSRQVLVAP